MILRRIGSFTLMGMRCWEIVLRRKFYRRLRLSSLTSRRLLSRWIICGIGLTSTGWMGGMTGFGGGVCFGRWIWSGGLGVRDTGMGLIFTARIYQGGLS